MALKEKWNWSESQQNNISEKHASLLQLKKKMEY